MAFLRILHEAYRIQNGHNHSKRDGWWKEFYTHRFISILLFIVTMAAPADHTTAWRYKLDSPSIMLAAILPQATLPLKNRVWSRYHCFRGIVVCIHVSHT
jgi:hypothetical protein